MFFIELALRSQIMLSKSLHGSLQEEEYRKLMKMVKDRTSQKKAKPVAKAASSSKGKTHKISYFVYSCMIFHNFHVDWME
jgi:hypothetical protein